MRMQARFQLLGLRACLAILSMLALLYYGALARGDDNRSVFDRIWGYATLYQSDSNRFVQKFALSGRLQLDAVHFDAKEGDLDDVDWRRFRFGFTTHVFTNFSARLEGDFDLNEEGTYERLTDAYIGWSPRDDWEVRTLKHSAGFTLDGATSSTKLLTPERNNLTNNLWFDVEYFTGLSITGETDNHWAYKAGVFSSDGGDELSQFEAGYFGLFSLGYDWAPRLGYETALVRVDYVNNEEDPNSATSPFRQVLSLVTEWEKDPWGLRTDLAAGQGFSGQSDIWGTVLMPYYNVNNTVQLVFRFIYIDSEGPNGIRLSRYEREVTSGRGDKYVEYYGGVNVYFYGHRLKWQTGVEYGHMNDDTNDGGTYRGWGVTSAIRLYW